MWKADFDKVKDSVVLDKYFPQTSLLLTQDYKCQFILDDRNLFADQHVPKKVATIFSRCFLLISSH